MGRQLNIFMVDVLVGILTQSTDGKLSFQYDHNYALNGGVAISISFPLQIKEFEGAAVSAFFSGLLPDEVVREKLAAHLGLSEKNPFALLEAVGGDCAGALSLYKEGETPSDITEDSEILDDVRLKAILDLIKRRPMLAGDDGYRLSLAGAQDKLAVGVKDGKIHLLKGRTPTTHILKPLIAHIKDSVHNELFCMQLAKRIGIDVPESMVHFVDNIPYYLVERYDRKMHKDGHVTRIHQEDFCQALGIVPEMKYEREGGPSIASCQAIITKYTAKPAADQIKFLDRIIFNYVIGNADAHGKNFSLLYKGYKPELAPAYDLLSTAIYPDLSAKMAMKIGGYYDPKDIYLRHFHKLMPDTKTAQSLINKQIQKISEKMRDEARTLKNHLKSNGLESDVFEDIIKVIDDRITYL
jgi:serine/threonine-protein kinase HipA